MSVESFLASSWASWAARNLSHSITEPRGGLSGARFLGCDNPLPPSWRGPEAATGSNPSGGCLGGLILSVMLLILTGRYQS